MPWPGGSSTVSKANYASPTGKAKKIIDALGLVLNAIVLWNTRYLDHLLNQGRMPATEDIARVSPLACDHINLHGRYQFTLDGPAAHGQLRALPNSA